MADFEFFEFTESGSKTVLMSESGTILNKFTLFSTPSGVEIFKNNKSLYKNNKGMFVYTFEPDDTNKTIKYIETKNFDLKTVNGENALKDYINALPSKRVALILYSDNTNKLSNTDTFFRSIGSMIWYTNFGGLVYNYVGVYRSDFKCIVSENHGVNESKLYIDIMFDKFDDIGLTGVPNNTINDDTEYSLNDNEMKNYPSNVISEQLSLYNLKSGDILLIGFDIFTSKESFDKGSKCTTSIQFFKNNIWKSGDNTINTLSDVYEHFDKYIKIPNDVDGFIVSVSKSSNTTGIAKVKNMTLTKCSNIEIENLNRSLISTNGLIMNRATELQKSGNPIKNLLNLSNVSGTVTASGFKEYEY